MENISESFITWTCKEYLRYKPYYNECIEIELVLEDSKKRGFFFALRHNRLVAFVCGPKGIWQLCLHELISRNKEHHHNHRRHRKTGISITERLSTAWCEAERWFFFSAREFPYHSTKSLPFGVLQIPPSPAVHPPEREHLKSILEEPTKTSKNKTQATASTRNAPECRLARLI